MNIWLVDTGPLVSYLDSGEVEHDRVGEALDSYAGVLATTAAVVTEAMHFIRRARRGFNTYRLSGGVPFNLVLDSP